MSYARRISLLREIEQERGSRVVTYFNSDRRTTPSNFSLPGLKTILATEAQPFLYDMLRRMGKAERLDLFLYTRGGQTDSVWPLVNLFREYGDKFAVLVPFRSHSAGALICLGADEVVMTDVAELSPVDPTTGNQFNPVDEIDKRSRRGISVEDVASFIELARNEERVGITSEQHILTVFEKLTDRVHPLALGNVNRVHNQIRLLARMLLKLHLEDKDKIDEVVDHLTRKLYSHTHAITRKEAIDLLGNGVARESTPREQELLWALYEEYAQVLNLENTFCKDELIDRVKSSADNQLVMDVIGGFIETTDSSRVFQSKCRVSVRSEIPQGVQLQVPPGQPVPLVPGLPVNINVEVLSIGYMPNEGGV